MIKHLQTYKTFDIVIVPFPFVDSPETKNRPVVVLSSAKNFNKIINHTIVMMITSSHHSKWPCDILIKNLKSTGLTKASLIRGKIFTIDDRLIKTKIGQLSLTDQERLKLNFRELFSPLFEQNNS